MLTASQVKTAKPREKPYKLADGGGMFLLVNPNGTKYWRLKYRVHGKEKMLALGVYPKVTLAEARGKRETARKQLKDGLDPMAEKQEAQRQSLLQSEDSFKALAHEWHEMKRDMWSPKHAARVLVLLENDIFPDLGHRPIKEISPPELLATLRKVEKRGALVLLSKVRGYCVVIYSFAIASGRAEHNIAMELQGVLKSPKGKHYPALKQSELPDFLRAVTAYGGEPTTRLGLRFLILTLVRTGELRHARWDEIDGKEWHLPAERMKTKVPHVVPLSRQALSILEELRPLTGRSELLFPGRVSLAKPISENTLLYAIHRMGYQGRATGHGFRATGSTILNEMGFNPDAIERQLAHAEKNKIRAAYNRAEYLPERQKMMQVWADLIDAQEAGVKVVPIHQQS